jgi:transcription elongation factor GreA
MAFDINNQSHRLLLTREGVRKLETELEDLKVNKRLEIAERIKAAISFGDLSENAEYDAAKIQQAFNEGRIREIELMLRQARIIEDDEVSLDIVGVGNAVRVYDMGYDIEEDYTIVGLTEADPKRLYVSSESPIGEALLGKRMGDEVSVNTPGGVLKLRIMEIRKR